MAFKTFNSFSENFEIAINLLYVLMKNHEENFFKQLWKTIFNFILNLSYILAPLTLVILKLPYLQRKIIKA